jgi:hypothetical protein
MDNKSEKPEEDLSAFKDYLEQFDNLMVFDKEDCPICGIKIPEKISDLKSPLVLLNTFNKQIEFKNLIEELKRNSIPYKIEKRINPEVIASIDYVYDLYIPISYKLNMDKIL